MSSSRVKSHKKDYSSDSSSSSSSSSSLSDSSCKDKKDRKKHCHKKDCDNESHNHHHNKPHSKNHSRNHSRSNSESSSEIECYSNDKEISKNKKHRKHHKDSSDSSSNSECKRKFNFWDVYQYFKNELLEDTSLMVAGSDAYMYITSTVPEQVSQTHSFKFDNAVTAFNVDRYPVGSSVFPREDGVYILFFICSTDTAAQFTVFVNGVAQPYTVVGSNSGAGQVVIRQLLRLKKDDNVVLRNWESGNSIKTNLYQGGNRPGNSLTFLLTKVGPYNPASVDCKNEHKFLEHLCPKKKKLFDKVIKKLILDKELMVKGFNVHGTFANRVSQIISVNSDVVFNENFNVVGLSWDPLSPSEIKVLEDGVYKLFFMVTTNTAAQFSITVNGVPVDSTTQGTNKGAGQLTMRALLELKQNDIITVRNYISANGNVVISEKAGGINDTISAILTMFKVANLIKPTIKPVDCKISEHYKCVYPLLKEYMLYKEKLQIAGSKCYLSTISSSAQNVDVDQTFKWSTNCIEYQMEHIQGNDYVTVEKTGLYDLFADIITDEPVQLALFVNNNPDNSTIFGRDSGANRCLMRQFVKLNKGDILSIKNWQSNGGAVNSAENAGGHQVGMSCMWMMLMLDPECNSQVPPPVPPPVPNPCHHLCQPKHNK